MSRQSYAADSIDLTAPIPQPVSGQLKMGGSNPQGVEINANSRYLTLGGKPWLAVMGEFHFSRYPHQEWEQEILKMKAGGIDVVSAYVFWIHHEEIEGQFDWSGDKDLRQFVQLCAKHGMYCFIRLGPWDHGEARNGGFPDWLLAKVPARQMRTTSPLFMGYTRTLYAEIFKQVHGLLYKDGGPIIGVQVENEMRSSAPYLLALKKLAREVGFDVPLYSMTGWGPARVPKDELLPMFGGYTDGFWIDGNTVAGASRIQFFFTHNPNDEGTSLRSRPGPLPTRMAYLNQYPYLTCEIGGGMAIAYARRPLIDWKDVAACALCKLGDGSNLMGYYMYHGGGNPPGKLTTLQETQATGYPNDLPEINYDFQAPIGQYGQIRTVYHALRRLHLFLHDFGSDLCRMPSTLPPELPKNLNDAQTLRWSVRSDGSRGYIFINNHERGVSMGEKQAQFDLHLTAGDQVIPGAPATVPPDSFMIWPFNLDVNGSLLRYATAQLLCRIQDGATPTYCFFAPAGMNAEFAFDAKCSVQTSTAAQHTEDGLTIIDGLTPGLNCTFSVRSPDGRESRILVLTDEQSLHLWKANLWGAERLFFSPCNLVFDESGLTILSEENQDPTVSIYPRPDAGVLMESKNIQPEAEGIFARYSTSAQSNHFDVQYRQIKEAGPARELPRGSAGKVVEPSDNDFDAAAVWQITIPPGALSDGKTARLDIDYAGDAARAYVGKRLLNDDFYYGRPWVIGLNRYDPAELQKEGITLEILPLRADSPVALSPEARPAPDANGSVLKLRNIFTEIERQTIVGLSK